MTQVGARQGLVSLPHFFSWKHEYTTSFQACFLLFSAHEAEKEQEEEEKKEEEEDKIRIVGKRKERAKKTICWLQYWRGDIKTEAEVENKVEKRELLLKEEEEEKIPAAVLKEEKKEGSREDEYCRDDGSGCV